MWGLFYILNLTMKYAILTICFGGMAEWLKAAVLKTVVPQGTVGSNPTSSAKSFGPRVSSGPVY